MKTVEIKSNDAGQRLDKFLGKAFPKLPPAMLYRALRIKRIKLNAGRADGAYKLRAGDVLQLYINDEFLESAPRERDFLRAGRELSVVYEDDNLLLLDKPEGLLCHEDSTEYIDTLLTRAKRYLYEKGEYRPDSEQSFAPALCNRIDRGTGGLVIAAKNAEALRVMTEKIRLREVKKSYLLVTEGVPKKSRGTLTSALIKDEARATVREVRAGTPGAKEAVTHYRVLAAQGGKALVEAELFTGRTHQIRVQFAGIGAPLWGDGKYGRAEKIRRSQALWAYKIEFAFSDAERGPLGYLAGRVFTVKDVPFLKEAGFSADNLF